MGANRKPYRKPTHHDMVRMYYKQLLLWAGMGILLVSCGQSIGSKNTTASPVTPSHTLSDKAAFESSFPATYNEFVYDRQVYLDPAGNYIVVENSLPKGGLPFTGLDGDQYVYAVFWTRITNETANPLVLSMAFPDYPYDLPYSPGRAFRLYFPTDTLTSDKIPQFDYGLSVDSFLTQKFYQPAELTKTIQPGAEGAFYVLTLFNQWVEGTLRTGLHLEGKAIYYAVNDTSIPGGFTNQPQLVLQD